MPNDIFAKLVNEYNNSVPPKPPNKIVWKVREWAEEAEISPTHVYYLMKTGKLKAVQTGTTWRILISPKEFYSQLAAEQTKILDLEGLV